MAPRKRQAAVLPLRLGTVSNFDRSSFPLLKAKGPLKEGTFFLELTLDEILQIREMSQGRNDYDRVFQNAKDRYDDLVLRKAQLEQRKEVLKRWQFFEMLVQYREARLFLEAGKALYNKTRTTSEMVRRGMASVSTIDVISVAAEDAQANQSVDGVAVQLDGLDDDMMSFMSETLSTLTDPFADPDPTGNDGETSVDAAAETPSTSLSSSSSTIALNIINNLYQSNSLVSGVNLAGENGVTINAGGSGNTGVMSASGPTLATPEVP